METLPATGTTQCASSPEADVPPQVTLATFNDKTSPVQNDSAVTPSANPDLPVETLFDDKLPQTAVLDPLSLLPWDSKNLKVEVTRLGETEIGIWTGKVHTYYNYQCMYVETDTKPAVDKLIYDLHASKTKLNNSQDIIRIKEEEIFEPVPKKSRDPCP